MEKWLFPREAVLPVTQENASESFLKFFDVLIYGLAKKYFTDAATHQHLQETREALSEIASSDEGLWRALQTANPLSAFEGSNNNNAQPWRMPSTNNNNTRTIVVDFPTESMQIERTSSIFKRRIEEDSDQESKSRKTV